MHVITFCNSKGGVAKTTSSVNCAAALGKLGFKVLLLDLDSQASATIHLGIEPGSKYHAELGLNKSIADCFYRKGKFEDSLVTIKNRFDLSRGSKELALIDLYLARLDNWYLVVKEILEGGNLQYDFIIIDTPPALNAITINAFIASDSLVIVTPPTSLDVSSLHNLLLEMNEIRALAPIGQVKGILLTRTRPVKTMQAHKEYLQKEFGEDLFDTQINESVAITESAANCLSIFDYKPRSAGARQYRNFTRELLFRIMNIRMLE